MREEKINLSDLKLWAENPRFPQEYFNKSEKELINYIFNKKGEKEKLKDLSKSIIENIKLIPWERLIVYNDGEQYTVLEGNRRLIIYKLLLNPSLLDDKKLASIFEKSKGIINNSLKVDCLVTENLENGLKYVELKHLETGYKSWGEPERNKFKITRGKAGDKEILKMEINKIVKKLDFPQKLKDDVLGHGFVTTFYRIVAETPAKNYFGYNISDNTLDIRDKQFEDKLKIIIWDVLNKKDSRGEKIDSRSLNKTEDVTKYLQNLNIEKEIPRLDEKIKYSYKTKVDVYNNRKKEFVSPTEKNKINNRKTSILLSENKLFGKTLSLKKSKVNNLYWAIDKIYEQNKNVSKNLETVLPIIGMSLRLILDVAAREYYTEEELKKENTPYRKFLKEVKSKLREESNYKNLGTLTLSWLVNQENFENILDHYAHDSVVYMENDILKLSKFIGEILERFFGR